MHVIVVDRKKDLDLFQGEHKAITTREYITNPEAYKLKTLKVVNLSGQCAYLDIGYYCSLLAEARSQKVVPTVDTILALERKTLYAPMLPELNALLRNILKRFDHEPESGFTLDVFFGYPGDQRLAELARRAFDLLRAPMLRLSIVRRERWEIDSIRPLELRTLTEQDRALLLERLAIYTRSSWRAAPSRTPARYSLAMLHDPDEALPPSNPAALHKFVAAGKAQGIDVEPITRKDYGRLAEFDALFIRATTAIDNHTFRFAKKAEREGIPAIDDATSILRCTNKVYLAELLAAHKIPTPKTVILDRGALESLPERISYPIVLKIPDGSFSRGVFKAENAAELKEISLRLFRESDVILAQEFMYTGFDWRVGVLNRQPFYVCQYFMSKKHWQIINHRPGGRATEGNYSTFALDDAPPAVVEIAVKAAGLIGDGLYGVDLKENDRGVFVIEVNDNPNIETGVEDAVLKDDLYRQVIADFLRRIERRH